MCSTCQEGGRLIKLYNNRSFALRVAVVFFIALSSIVSSHAAAETGNGSREAALSDFKRLEGKWQRPDGGYVLELSEIKPDGSLKATYFNPRPINVSRAELSRKDGKLVIFIELRDINYPGSTYNLHYDPRSDRLKGKYFQAVQGETYDIEFMRGK